MAAKHGPNVLICMPISAKCILLVSVMHGKVNGLCAGNTIPGQAIVHACRTRAHAHDRIPSTHDRTPQCRPAAGAEEACASTRRWIVAASPLSTSHSPASNEMPFLPGHATSMRCRQQPEGPQTVVLGEVAGIQGCLDLFKKMCQAEAVALQR
jgi:hypothetical protein